MRAYESCRIESTREFIANPQVLARKSRLSGMTHSSVSKTRTRRKLRRQDRRYSKKLIQEQFHEYF